MLSGWHIFVGQIVSHDEVLSWELRISSIPQSNVHRLSICLQSTSCNGNLRVQNLLCMQSNWAIHSLTCKQTHTCFVESLLRPMAHGHGLTDAGPSYCCHIGYLSRLHTISDNTLFFLVQGSCAASCCCWLDHTKNNKRETQRKRAWQKHPGFYRKDQQSIRTIRQRKAHLKSSIAIGISTTASLSGTASQNMWKPYKPQINLNSHKFCQILVFCV